MATKRTYNMGYPGDGIFKAYPVHDRETSALGDMGGLRHYGGVLHIQQR